ncbi:MAG: hypothetical protein RL141_1040 [Candidatus Parcubacteria bacterium]|jgi:leucyl aminopeptidase
MTISIRKGALLTEACDLLVIGVFEGNVDKDVASLDALFGGDVRKLLVREGFTGKQNERQVFPSFGHSPAKKVLLVGMGSRADFSTDMIRRVGGAAARCARTIKATQVCMSLIGAGVRGIRPEQAAQALGEGLRLGWYTFHTYQAPKPAAAMPEVTVMVEDRSVIRAAEKGLARAAVLADATAFARDLVNTPSHHMHPGKMAEVAQTLVTRGRIRCKVLSREMMEKMGMGATLAVGDGSAHQPVGIHLTYTPPRAPKRRVAVIGKAVTFDSGGLNLKPEQGMTTMKIDMAGAATVLGLFKALAALNVPVEVHGLFLAVENMPSGSAYRPGDIVRAMNGTTIEILNTDAEGRLTLADALSYAVAKVKPDVMVDLATLTGAAVVALGDDITAIMGNHPATVKGLREASVRAGEHTWELPLFAPYDEAIKSGIADINNTGGRSAGTIKAGLFLQRFVGETPWAHLDIAGPSYCEKETRPDLPLGGTGWGVRTLMEWLEQMA